jgi:hypothetical protein
MSINENLLNVIQKLLNYFKIDTYNFYFPLHFTSNEDLYIAESQMPDLWLKTRKQFNRNDCFMIEPNEYKPFSKYDYFT